MAESADLRLIERCKAGDETAFAELVDRHKDLVYGLIVRVLGDRERADDLAQEVFVRVHRGLPYFRGEASLTTWIFRIVLNLCSQALGRRHPDVALDETDGTGRRRSEPSHIDRAYDDLELRDRRDKAMAQLPDRRGTGAGCGACRNLAGGSARGLLGRARAPGPRARLADRHARATRRGVGGPRDAPADPGRAG